MQDLLEYNMNDVEKAVWTKLKDDIINEVLSIHVPVVEDEFVVTCITEEVMEPRLPYVGVQGYKSNRGFYFITDDNRRPPKLEYIIQDYDEIKQKLIKETAQAIATLYVRLNRNDVMQKWDSNTWSMIENSTGAKRKIKEFDSRKYEWDIQIFIEKELLPEEIVEKDLKYFLNCLNYNKKYTWTYSEENREFLIV